MKQSKSILFLTRLYHPHIGGVEKHVAILSSALMTKGYAVSIITERHSSKLPLIEMIDGVSVYRIPVSKNGYMKKFYIWKWVLQNLNLFLRQDIIHIHDVFYWLLPFRVLLITKKIYITFHGYEGYPVRFVWKLQRKIAERLSFGNICVGDFMKKWYLTVPTSVIYGGVRLDDNKYKQEEQSAVFFGRLDSQTGILEYVKAFRKIKEKFPKFKFTVVGEGELKRKIPKGIKIEKFTQDVSKYIGKSRFIFVSRYLSMLEALVQKKEVVAVYTDPIMKDYLMMSPFAKYTKVCKTSDEIAHIVIESLKTKPNNKKLEEGCLWAKKQTWENILSVYLKLWE